MTRCDSGKCLRVLAPCPFVTGETLNLYNTNNKSHSHKTGPERNHRNWPPVCDRTLRILINFLAQVLATDVYGLVAESLSTCWPMSWRSLYVFFLIFDQCVGHLSYIPSVFPSLLFGGSGCWSRAHFHLFLTPPPPLNASSLRSVRLDLLSYVFAQRNDLKFEFPSFLDYPLPPP